MKPNKHIIKAREESLKIKRLNQPSGKHCLKCQKTLSFIAFSLSSLCRSCEQEIKKQKYEI